VDSSNRAISGIPIAAFWAGGLFLILGVSMTLFGVHGLLATTILGVAIGPLSLLFLNGIDAAIGITIAVSAICFLRRRPWAGWLIRRGWVPLLCYEIGRTLGLAAAGISSVSGTVDIVMSSAAVALIVSAGICASSPSAIKYAEGT
jgi:hypothetical protein